jgi:hypothetical protein
MYKKFLLLFFVAAISFLFQEQVVAQGVTTAAMNGYVKDADGNPLPNANVIAEHTPSGSQYGASTRDNGLFNLPNLRIGGPYTVTVSYIGYVSASQENIQLTLGQNFRLEFTLQSEAVEIGQIVVSGEQDNVLNSGRTGAETFVSADEIKNLPSIKRTTRDLIRLDPRSDGNYSFGGKNWLYNNISVDGSYFNNSFGLDDPAPGGQTAAEPIPFDAVEQVQVSIAPFDVRQGGFTGAGVNTVTKSGSNQWNGSLYTFGRNETFVGNQVSGNQVVANPDLSYYQSGFSVSGPIVENKLFFFLNAELERRKDPGTDFVASVGGSSGFGVSRVDASVMDSIRMVMSQLGYETGPYQGFTHETNNDKILLKLDWNVNENNNVSFRYNYLDAVRGLPPHPFVFAFNNTQRGPNENSLPFQNTGYKINNELNSFALEINSRSSNWANRFFASYNIFRDFREPFSTPFPTIEIGEGGSTYTTLGHEPFSIRNILDQDVLQITNNFSYFAGDHVITLGANYELYSFFNSFNIFYHGVVVYPTLGDFFTATDTTDFSDLIGSGPFKGEDIEVAQFSIYAQDEFLVSERLNLKYGLRVDIPIYITEPVDNPFVRSLNLVDADGNPTTFDQSKLPDATPLFAPRVGFNWDIKGDRSTQLRGGTGIFTGRVPFVWIGNNISNPGANPNLPSHLQSFFINVMAPDFKWPQVWNTNLAVDHMFPGDWLLTLEGIYGKDINAVVLYNADLPPTNETLPGPDGRPFYTASTLNPGQFPPDGGAGVIVIDNTDEGYHFSATVQLRKNLDFGLNTSLAYTYLQAESQLRSTEIARSLWEGNPVQGNPNKPELSYSEFGARHRFTGFATYSVAWSDSWTSHFGLFVEVAEGNRFVGAGGNRYSYTYSGDVNGDGTGGNDLIYIPRNQSEIHFDPLMDPITGAVISTPDEQWAAFNAFIEQDPYLKENRGKIADRFGAVNPWWWNIDFKFMQDFSFLLGNVRHTFQLSLDILNVPSLLNSDWGVRQFAQVAATTPLTLQRFDSDPANSIADGTPIFTFSGVEQTFLDSPDIQSRWQLQLGIRYFFGFL